MSNFDQNIDLYAFRFDRIPNSADKDSLDNLEYYLGLYKIHRFQNSGFQHTQCENNPINKIERLFEIAIEKYGLTCITDFDKSKLKNVLMVLQREKFRGRVRSSNTLRSYVSTIKSFMRFLRAMNYIHDNPLQDYKSPKFVRPIRRNIPETEQIRDLLGDIDVANPLTHRNLTAIALMADLGCRVGALRELRFGDIDLDASTINIDRYNPSTDHKVGLKGFGGWKPLSPSTNSILAHYIETSWKQFKDGSLCRGGPFTEKLPDQELLFPSKNGYEMGINKFSESLNKTIRSHGLNKVTTHCLRHHLILALNLKGASLAQIMAISGHRDPRTLENYIREDPRHLRNIQEQFNPLWQADNDLDGGGTCVK